MDTPLYRLFHARITGTLQCVRAAGTHRAEYAAYPCKTFVVKTAVFDSVSAQEIPNVGVAPPEYRLQGNFILPPDAQVLPFGVEVK